MPLKTGLLLGYESHVHVVDQVIIWQNTQTVILVENVDIANLKSELTQSLRETTWKDCLQCPINTL